MCVCARARARVCVCVCVCVFERAHTLVSFRLSKILITQTVSLNAICIFASYHGRESGNEFQRTLPEYTRLDLKRSVLGIGILRERESERQRDRERQTDRQAGRQADRETDRDCVKPS